MYNKACGCIGTNFPTRRPDVICTCLCPPFYSAWRPFFVLILLQNIGNSKSLSEPLPMQCVPYLLLLTGGPYSGTEFSACPDRTSLRKLGGNAEKHLTLNMPLSKRSFGNLKNTPLLPNNVSTRHFRHFGDRRSYFPLSQKEKCTPVFSLTSSSWSQRIASDWQPSRHANEFRMENLSQMVQGAWYVLVNMLCCHLISDHEHYRYRHSLPECRWYVARCVGYPRSRDRFA